MAGTGSRFARARLSFRQAAPGTATNLSSVGEKTHRALSQSVQSCDSAGLHYAMNSDTRIPYLLLFRNTGPENFQHLSSDQKQHLVTRWNTWYDSLVEQGLATEGQPLETDTRVVSGPAGQRVTDGPFAEAKEAVGGYVKVLARDLEEATAIARRHPGLDYGLIIEIRQLAGSCHLGVAAHGHAPEAVVA